MTEQDLVRIKNALDKMSGEVVTKETRDCLRVYKARVSTLPNASTGKCGVVFSGDTTEISALYTAFMANSAVGDIVWVAVPYNNLRNAVVWADSRLQTGLSADTAPVIRFIGAHDVDGTGVPKTTNPMSFTIEVLSGEVKVGDEIQLCYRKMKRHKGKKRRYPLVAFESCTITEADIGKRYLSVSYAPSYVVSRHFKHNYNNDLSASPPNFRFIRIVRYLDGNGNIVSRTGDIRSSVISNAERFQVIWRTTSEKDSNGEAWLKYTIL